MRFKQSNQVFILFSILKYPLFFKSGIITKVMTENKTVKIENTQNAHLSAINAINFHWSIFLLFFSLNSLSLKYWAIFVDIDFKALMYSLSFSWQAHWVVRLIQGSTLESWYKLACILFFELVRPGLIRLSKNVLLLTLYLCCLGDPVMYRFISDSFSLYNESLFVFDLKMTSYLNLLLRNNLL